MIKYLKKNNLKIFTPQEIEELKAHKIPEHLAIMMDGNRRWAKEKKLPISLGHKKGADNLKMITRAAAQIGIKYLTCYAFSTENWNRSSGEVFDLLKLLENYLIKLTKELVKEGVKLSTIGDLTKFPKKLQHLIQESKEKTKNGETIEVILALNYGSRDEITRTVLKIIADYDKQEVDINNFTEEHFTKYLDTNKWPDPDLLIRTSGEMRVSNFLLWQISYSELYLTDTLWPSFSASNLYQAILEYQKRKRRKGL